MTMLNINPGHNKELLKGCKTLHDYAVYTARVRTHAKSMSLEDAVERAIHECIEEDILADFLRENRVEAKKMSIYEYDEERHMQKEREASREEGRIEGREEGIQIGIEKGVTEGMKKGVEKGVEATLKLTLLLMQAGRTDDLKRAALDEQFCQSLYKEFNIL